MQQLDVLCVGDGIIDAFLLLQHADEHSHEADEGREFCFRLGAKIPVDDCQFLLGGDASNVAVGLSRLGFTTALVAETGDDAFAHMITVGLEKEHVGLDFFKQTPNTPATFSVNIVFMQDRTILSRHVKRAHDLQFQSAQTKWVYLTSVGEEWKGLYQRVLEYVKEKNVKLAFNPGSHQLKEGRDSFMNVLHAADVVFVNREEAEKIAYGTERMTDGFNQPETLLRELQKLGPKVVNITDGDQGSYAIDQTGKVYHQGILPGKFVQKTGVGDAYASGFLASFMQDETDIQKAMLWGAGNASAVIEHMGAQGGLLTKEQLIKRVML